MASAKIYIFLQAFLMICSVLVVSTLARQKDSDEDSKEKILKVSSSSKGDTTVPTSSRYTSARAYVDERKRDGYRYYGTGSKSGNSFLPTKIHKSTSSLDSHNYFVTNKSNLKDLDTAGSGMAGASEGNGGYLTEYESPAMMNMNSAHGGGSSGTGGGSGIMVMGMDEHFGDMGSETGHGSGYGHGGGGGQGKGCNSALGLLGVLGLAAYLQNVLRMMNGTAGRRRRDVLSLDDPDDLEVKLKKVRTGMATNLDEYFLPLNETSEDMELNEDTYKNVLKDVFPLLSAVAHARDGLIPIHCTHSSVCLANRILVKDLGYMGHGIGIRISAAIAKFMAKLTKDERAEQIRMIYKAGKMGRNGRNCLKVFPTCNRLKKLPTYNIPSIFESGHDPNHNSAAQRPIASLGAGVPQISENK